MSDTEPSINGANHKRRGCIRPLGCFVSAILFAACGLCSCDILLDRYPLWVTSGIKDEFYTLMEQYNSAEHLFISEGEVSPLDTLASEDMLRFWVELCNPEPCSAYDLGGVIMRQDKFDVLEVNDTFAILRYDFAWGDEPDRWGRQCGLLLNTDEGWKVDYSGPMLPPVCPTEKYSYYRSRTINYLIYLLTN